MATTTNYSWATPDDTDLVKDGAAAIRTLGSSADTTVKNLNPGTTAGDIDYYTSGTAKARVAIGTAGQVLQVNSGATAPEWVTPGGEGPAFQAHLGGSNQSVSSSVWTKVQLNTEEYDTNSNFDSTTNYRFTPTVAGKYLIGYAMNTNVGTIAFAIYKNGILYKYFPMGAGSLTAVMNGTTDYVEIYVFLTGASPVLYSGADSNTAFGNYVRS
jgi:hypothetical protein